MSSPVRHRNHLPADSCGIQAGWLILKSFPEHVDVLAFMNAIESLYGAKSLSLLASSTWRVLLFVAA